MAMIYPLIFQSLEKGGRESSEHQFCIVHYSSYNLLALDPEAYSGSYAFDANGYLCYISWAAF